MRPIDADALSEILKTIANEYKEMGETLREKAVICAVKCLESEEVSPTLDYAPVMHGEWIISRKHEWKKDDDGDVDEWAWESGFHNGTSCIICHKSPCIHCDPDYDEKEDCREHYVCSVCGRIVLSKESYCHCGAKMDGGKKDG